MYVYADKYMMLSQAKTCYWFCSLLSHNRYTTKYKQNKQQKHRLPMKVAKSNIKKNCLILTFIRSYLLSNSYYISDISNIIDYRMLYTGYKTRSIMYLTALNKDSFCYFEINQHYIKCAEDNYIIC